MKIIVKSNTRATIQLNKDAMFYVGRFVRDGKIVLKGIDFGDFLAQGFGWFQLTSDRLKSAVLLVRSCMNVYRKYRDGELRALLAIKQGAQVIAVTYNHSPFVQYTLAPRIEPVRKQVRRIQESALRRPLLGMRPTNAQLSALVNKFAKV